MEDSRTTTALDIILTMRKARSEHSGVPLSTIATMICEGIADRDELRNIISLMTKYVDEV